MLEFNEPYLSRQLEKLDATMRSVFAAACAERLLPAYIAYAGRYEIGHPEILRAALDGVWQSAGGGGLAFNPDEMHERCLALVPSDDECGKDGIEYVEDAVVAVACAACAITSDDARKALLSATRAYEALDTYLSYELDVDFNRPGAESAVLGHPIVQAELERQRHDLEELASAGSDKEAVVLRIRARAIEEAQRFFGQSC